MPVISSTDLRSSHDPTKGFVQYVSADDATAAGLARKVNNQIYLGVDDTTVLSASGAGRKSVRLESSQTFNNGLLIADLAHIPNNTCGTWPAYWTINNQGNPYGEIDIIEGINDQDYNDISLHTSAQCTLTGGNQTGTGLRTDCNLDSSPGGCGVSGDSASYGSGFNANGGGLYVLYLEDALKVWLFPRDSIPADITSGSPNPSSWGEPLMDFESQSGCSISQNFIDQTIIFNIDFCGSNAGGQGWTDWSHCPQTTGVSTCEAYVAANPSAFTESYFLINSVKLYQTS
ncbi:Hyaluronidase [Rasamsonia emersonii CBS 393.64]|uniref:Hyaluronidase n=1 Tax=Rasamsonia emersonii (strain ATCC 16479 / CBS 393.64 / IMI 116815) TaxID=1408163 RepID=A0A0F4YGV8_RASE3|nr:Hyaluronidase [Rasamsonia emersonii CBS 393.64]KKA16868.1 Hyaluronidase [Rasamsonia emersonii CBS 393.64]